MYYFVYECSCFAWCKYDAGLQTTELETVRRSAEETRTQLTGVQQTLAARESDLAHIKASRDKVRSTACNG